MDNALDLDAGTSGILRLSTSDIELEVSGVGIADAGIAGGAIGAGLDAFTGDSRILTSSISCLSFINGNNESHSSRSEDVTCGEVSSNFFTFSNCA